MVNQSHSTDVADEPYSTPDRTSAPPPYPGMPRWVKLAGIIALVLVLLVVVLMVAGVGGQHGPGRHLPSGGAGSSTPPVTLAAQRP